MDKIPFAEASERATAHRGAWLLRDPGVQRTFTSIMAASAAKGLGLLKQDAQPSWEARPQVAQH